MSRGRERELKYLYAATRPPQLPEGWSLEDEEPLLALQDTYLDSDGALAARRWGLRRRGGEGRNIIYTLKRDAASAGALHNREEIEAVALGEAGEPDAAALPDEIRTAVDHAFGPDAASRLRPTITLNQQRRSWTLVRQGAPVAVMTMDQVTDGKASWGELEIEFVSSVSDHDVEHFAQELHAALARDPQISVSTESKGERARRLSL